MTASLRLALCSLSVALVTVLAAGAPLPFFDAHKDEAAHPPLARDRDVQNGPARFTPPELYLSAFAYE